MLILLPVYGSDESVTMIPYELTFPLCVVEASNSVTTYRMLDEIERTIIDCWLDGEICVSICPHDFGENTKEDFFQEDFIVMDFLGDDKEKVELSEIEDLLKRFSVLLYNKIDNISTNVKPFQDDYRTTQRRNDHASPQPNGRASTYQNTP